MQATERLRRRDARRRFQARKLRRLLEDPEASLEEIARAVEEVDGLAEHLRGALPQAHGTRLPTLQVLNHLGLRRVAALVRGHWLRAA